MDIPPNQDRERKANILIVDDTPSNLRLLSHLLQDQGYAIRSALDGDVAIIVAESGWPDLILLDIVMPKMDGYEVCQKLKQNEHTREIPVIFLSTLEDIFDKKKAFAVGGIDYIPKSFDNEELLIRIESQLTIQLTKAEVIRLNAELEARVRERTKELEIANQKLQKEINNRQKAEDQMLRKALRDPMTGLANRNSFIGKLKQAIQQTQKKLSYNCAVLLLECDRFKKIKHNFGYFEANQLLIAISQRLTSCLPKNACVSRFEGDDFAILIEPIASVEEINRLAQKIQDELADPIVLKQQEILVNKGLGIVIVDQDYDKVDRILNDANIALQKSNIQGQYQIFSPDMTGIFQEKNSQNVTEEESMLRRGIERQEFILYYQPIIAISTGEIVEIEALVRWQHPQKGLIFPTEFIPIAEQYNLIVPIGYLILLEACRQIMIWRNEHQIKLRVSINLSAQQFTQFDFIEKLDEILDATGAKGSYLKFEIPEKAIANYPQKIIDLIHQLKKRDIELSIDNFGSEYCSWTYLALTYLISFSINYAKIDSYFINLIEDSNNDLGLDYKEISLFEKLLNLARQMDITVTAKGVESRRDLESIQLLDCKYAQGNVISKPLDCKSLEELLLWTKF